MCAGAAPPAGQWTAKNPISRILKWIWAKTALIKNHPTRSKQQHAVPDWNWAEIPARPVPTVGECLHSKGLLDGGWRTAWPFFGKVSGKRRFAVKLDNHSISIPQANLHLYNGDIPGSTIGGPFRHLQLGHVDSLLNFLLLVRAKRMIKNGQSPFEQVHQNDNNEQQGKIETKTKIHIIF